MSYKSSGSASACAIAIALFGAYPAIAQDTPEPAPQKETSEPTSEENKRLGVVYVTATKRSESTQDIPIAVDVVDGTTLSTKGVGSLLQIESLAPGVQLVRSPTGQSRTGVTVRGIGSSPGASVFESSVSLFVDGVYAPRSREYTGALFDVERIEVVKGTQAALLGKNTSAGAINVIPAKPGTEYAAELTASYEFELESTSLLATVDLPVNDTLRFRVAAQKNDQGGWVENIISGQKATEMDDAAVRGIMVFEPNDDLDFTLLAQHSETDLSGTPFEIVTNSALAVGIQAADGYPDTLDGKLDGKNAGGLFSPGEPGYESLKNDRIQATLNYQLGDHTLTSVTGWSAYTANGATDGDSLAGTHLYQLDNEKSSQFLQELRLVSPDDSRFDYVVGVLYLNNLLKSNTLTDVDYPFGPAAGVLLSGAYKTTYNQLTEAWSVFGQGTFDVTDRARVVAGLRYTDEKKDFDIKRETVRPGFYSLVVIPPFAPLSLQRSEDNFDYSFGFQYDVSGSGMAYLSYGKGTKAGGFADSATDLTDSEFETETAKTLEAGLKWNGSDWQLNGAAFATQIDGFQVVTFNGSQFVVSNADLETNGFEVSSWWQATDNLRVSFDSTYAKARNRDTGNKIPNAPDWSGSIGVDYFRSITDTLDVFLNGSVDWRSEVTYQQDPDAAMKGEAFTTANLTIGVGPSDDRWRLSLIGRNLTDESSASFSFPTPLVGAISATSEMPRTIALQAKMTF